MVFDELLAQQLVLTAKFIVLADQLSDLPPLPPGESDPAMDAYLRELAEESGKLFNNWKPVGDALKTHKKELFKSWNSLLELILDEQDMAKRAFPKLNQITIIQEALKDLGFVLRKIDSLDKDSMKSLHDMSVIVEDKKRSLSSLYVEESENRIQSDFSPSNWDFYLSSNGSAYFALALHSLFGFDIVALVDDSSPIVLNSGKYPKILHVFALNDLGQAIDITGKRTIEDIKGKFPTAGNTEILHMSPYELISDFMGYGSMPKPLPAYNPHKVNDAKKVIMQQSSKFGDRGITK